MTTEIETMPNKTTREMQVTDQAKTIGDLVQKVGLPVLLSLVFVGFLLYMTNALMVSSEADKMFQREQTKTLSNVVMENTSAMLEVKHAVDELKTEFQSRR